MASSKIDVKKSIIFTFLLGITMILIGILSRSYSALTPNSTVEIFSQKLSFVNENPGAWKLTETAKWVDENTVHLDLTLDSIEHMNYENQNVVLVYSDSLTNNQEFIANMQSLVDHILKNSSNEIALITYGLNSEILQPFTNDSALLKNQLTQVNTNINRINYYKAYASVIGLLNREYVSTENYQIVIFSDYVVTDDSPAEVAEYNFIKSEYPNVSILGVAYDTTTRVLEQLNDFTDSQIKANDENFEIDVMSNIQLIDFYQNFSIAIQLNSDDFEILNTNIESSFGNVSIQDDEILLWDFSNTLVSGKNVTCSIDLKIRDSASDVIYPIINGTDVVSLIDTVSEEVTHLLGLVVSTIYTVSYNANAPTGCQVSGLPESVQEHVYSTVTISSQTPTCDGYRFRGWKSTNADLTVLNDDYFVMPEEDVVFVATWSKVGINKSMNGQIYEYADPILQSVASSYNEKIWKYRSQITKIVFQDNLHTVNGASEVFDVSESQNGSVMAYIVPNLDQLDTYTAYIQGDGKVIANADSSYLFFNFTALESIEGMEYFDTSNVTNMHGLFFRCSSLKQIDLSNFDTSNVTNMEAMFYCCFALIECDVSSFDTSRVTNTSFMFAGYQDHMSLENIIFGDKWDVTNVTTMASMFQNCSSIVSLDLSKFYTPNVTSMKSMFVNCFDLVTLSIPNFDTSNVTDMQTMFGSCQSLTSLDLSHFNTSKVTNMSYMFRYCKLLTHLDVSNFDVRNVTDMSYMFGDCSVLETLDLSSFITSSVTTMNHMFSNCTTLVSLDISNFNTAKVTDMAYMFYNCLKITKLDLRNFNTSNVETMERMFLLCRELADLNVSSFNTSKVTNMSYMFSYCAFTTMDLRNFDTSNVETMASLFDGCPNLVSVDLSSFNTSKVTSFANMFYMTQKLESLDLSNFDTSSATNMTGMFIYCISLKEVKTGSRFVTTNVTDMSKMFQQCYNIVITFTLSGNNVSAYMDIFTRAATAEGAQITINYTSDAASLVDTLIATKSDTSNVVKGSLIS